MREKLKKPHPTKQPRGKPKFGWFSGLTFTCGLLLKQNWQVAVKILVKCRQEDGEV